MITKTMHNVRLPKIRKPYSEQIVKIQMFPDLYLAVMEYRKRRDKRITLVNFLLQVAYSTKDIRPDILQNNLNISNLDLPVYLVKEIQKVKDSLKLQVML